MLFLPNTVPAVTSSGDCATRAAIECLIAYTHGLEGCDIQVETSDGEVKLAGHASCDAAVTKAVEIAAGFTSKPVHSSIEVISARPLVRLHIETTSNGKREG